MGTSYFCDRYRKNICAHVHDELIIECREDVSLNAICEQMGRTPP